MNPLKIITKPIGCLCSLIGALILGFFLLGVFGLWSFNHLAPQGVKEIVESRGGFPVTVDEAGWHLFDSAFVSEDIMVQNPANFPETDFLHIRTLSLKGDAKEWLAGDTRDIEELTLDIEHVNWVITEGGSSNVSLFAEAVTEKNSGEDAENTVAQATDEKDIRVLSWVIKLGTIEISDYSRGEVRREKHILHYEQRFVKAEPAGVVVQVVASDFADQGLQPMLHQLLTAILSVPDVDGLTDDLNPAPDWLKDKLKSDD